jgi:hypothetical protein
MATLLPNQFTPLAFLPPNIAQLYQLANYITVATLSAFIWDWLMSIPEEIAIVRKRGFRLPIVAYFMSRIGTLGCCTLALVFLAAPLTDCYKWTYAIGGCFIIALPSTSALFFFRVRAVYCDNRTIMAFFGFLLFALFGTSFLIPFSPTAAHVGPTQRCMVIEQKRYGAIPSVINFTLDTLVFFAISFRIISCSIENHSFRALLRSFFRGDGLFSLSRSLLHSGQLYYCATFGLNLVVMVLNIAPVSPVYVVFCIPNIALESSMACRVFRGIRLGTIEDTASFGLKSSSGPSACPVPIAFKNDSTSKVQGLDTSRHSHIAIEFTETSKIGESDAHIEQKLRDIEGYHDGDSSSDDEIFCLDAV